MAKTSLEGFPYDGVSFDMDGTLYSLDHFKVNLALRKPTDLPMWMTMEKVRKGVRRSGVSADDMGARVVEEMAELLSKPASEVSEKVREMLDVDWPWLLTKVGPFSGIGALLDRLVVLEIPMVVNSDYPGDLKVKALGLGDYPWLGILDATTFGALKPRPEVFRAAAETLGAEPHRVLHVGDSPELDMQGANAAGLHSVLVGGHKPKRGVAKERPTHRFRSMNRFCKAALQALEGHPGRGR